MELVLSPYEQAKEQFMNGTYEKHVVTGEVKEIRGNHIITSTGTFHDDWYRLPNELGA